MDRGQLLQAPYEVANLDDSPKQFLTQPTVAE